MIADFQSEMRRQGQEQIDVVADAAGTYLLAITPGPGIDGGTYAIRMVSRRAATDADRSTQEVRALRTAAVATGICGEIRPGAGALRAGA